VAERKLVEDIRVVIRETDDHGPALDDVLDDLARDLVSVADTVSSDEVQTELS
jgi:hypothetical protein